MTFDQLMQNGWDKTPQPMNEPLRLYLVGIADELREKLLLAETRIFQLERENALLRGKYPAGGPMPGLIAPKVRAKIARPVLTSVLSTKEGMKVAVAAPVLTTRQYIFFAFGARCFYCRHELQEHRCTMDHQIPKSKGGRNHRDNLVLACGDCNTTKGDRMPTPDELERAHLIREAFDKRPANSEQIRDPWIAEQETKIEHAVKPNAIYTVRNNLA